MLSVRAARRPFCARPQYNTTVCSIESMSFQPKGIVKRPRQRLEQAELDRMVLSHERFQAGRPGGQRAVLSYMDLSRLNLVGKNLSNATLTASFLIDVNLAGVDLSHANLFGCDLTRANLRGACLVRADLRGACLRRADLTGANLFDADLRDRGLAQRERNGEIVPGAVAQSATELGGATMAKANLSQARLSGASALHTDFSDALMQNCKLMRADLRHANLSGANLESADLSGADLRGADLRNAVLMNATMSSVEMGGADLQGTLTNAQAGHSLQKLGRPLEELVALHQLWVQSFGAEGKQLDLSGFDLRTAAALSRASLPMLKASGAAFFCPALDGAALQTARLDGSDLRSL